MGQRRFGHLLVLALVVAAGCAPKMTPQQALVEEAFKTCRVQGPSTKLERVERDGRFLVVGRDGESQRVHDCMVRYAEPAKPSAPAPRAESLAASRLPGTWRGTLKLPPRAAGEAEVASPATVRFAVAAGAIKWTLATNASGPALAADGTAVVVDGELRMTGIVRAPARPSGEAARSSITVRYAGAMVGDRLEVTGVTTDRQVHLLSVRRVAE